MANVLVLGSGGREHALAWKLSQSKLVDKIYWAPGIPSLAKGQRWENVALDATKMGEDFSPLLEFVHNNAVDLTVVGPEAPLVAGVADVFRAEKKLIYGPGKIGAQLEGSKFFSYDMMESATVPQAFSLKCYTLDDILENVGRIENHRGVVLKADGLHGGKGVRVYDSAREARADASDFVKAFGAKALAATRHEGPEYSVFGFVGKGRVRLIPAAFQDHKRLLDGDKGPNTGGMGAYGPVPFVTSELLSLTQEYMTRTIQALPDGVDYGGFLYAGMMLTQEGPITLEYNVRFGDPECQAAMMLLKGDLYEYMMESITGNLGQLSVNPGHAMTVVMAAQGYPDSPKKEGIITGIADAEIECGVQVFHAGTTLSPEGKLKVNGGRVLGVSRYDTTLAGAARNIYKAIRRNIRSEPAMQYRTDIGAQALNAS